MDLTPVFIAYVTLCALIGLEAKRQGRFGMGVFVLSFVFTPFITLWYLVISSESGIGGSRVPTAAPSVKTPLDRRPDAFRSRDQRPR